jgi:hypothetical protein
MNDNSSTLARIMLAACAAIGAYAAIRGQIHVGLLFRRYVVMGWIARLAGATLCLIFLFLLYRSFYP